MLKLEIEQYEAFYKDIGNGHKPRFEYDPQIEEECCLFGCTRHNNPF